MSRMTRKNVKQRVCKAIVDFTTRLRELARIYYGCEPRIGF